MTPLRLPPSLPFHIAPVQAKAKFFKEHKILAFPTVTDDGVYDLSADAFLRMEAEVLACGDKLVAYQVSIRGFISGMAAGAQAGGGGIEGIEGVRAGV